MSSRAAAPATAVMSAPWPRAVSPYAAARKKVTAAPMAVNEACAADHGVKRDSTRSATASTTSS